MKTKLEIFTILPKNNHKLGDLFTFWKLFYTKKLVVKDDKHSACF